MPFYTVTITPDSGSPTTMRVDATGPVPRIRELTVCRDEGADDAGAPPVDFELLMLAVLPGSGLAPGPFRPPPGATPRACRGSGRAEPPHGRAPDHRPDLPGSPLAR